MKTHVINLPCSGAQFHFTPDMADTVTTLFTVGAFGYGFFGLWCCRGLESIVNAVGHNTRVQHWLDRFSSFNYTLVYRIGAAHANADFLLWFLRI